MGFFARSASWNAIRRPSVLLVDAGLPYHTKIGFIARTAYPLDRLASILAVDPDWVSRRRHVADESNAVRSRVRFSVGGATLRVHHLEYRLRRLSPAALRLNPHHRELWHVSTIPACTETWDTILESCPACGAELDWKRARGVTRCTRPECLHDLLEAPAACVADAVRPGVALCAALLNPDPGVHHPAVTSLPETIRGEDRGDLFELAWVLGCMEDPACFANVQTPKKLDSDRRCAALFRGADLIAAWPKCLKDLLARSVEKDPSGATTKVLVDQLRSVVVAQVDYGRISTLLDAELAGIRFNSFSTMIGQSLGYMTTLGFCQATGFSRSDIKKLRLQDALPHLVVRGGVRTLALFSEATANDVNARVRSRVTAAALTRDLGIALDGVYDMIAEGLLQVDDDAVIRCLWPELHIVSKGATSLRDALSGCVKEAELAPTMVRLAMALRVCPAVEKPWVALVRAVLDGSLKVVRRPGDAFNLRNGYVERHTLPLIRRMPLTTASALALDKPAWISDLDARDRLSCDHRGLRHLVRTEQLTSSGRFNGATFVRADVDALASRLINTTEIAARLDRSPLSISLMLRDADLHVDDGGFLQRKEVVEELGLDRSEAVLAQS